MKLIVVDNRLNTLQRIAARVYGDWSLWPLIRDANSHLRDRLGADWWEAPPTATPLICPTALTQTAQHRVVDGDTFLSLSENFYGTEAFSERIRAANGGTAIFDLLGSVIDIPPLASVDQIRIMEAL